MGWNDLWGHSLARGSHAPTERSHDPSPTALSSASLGRVHNFTFLCLPTRLKLGKALPSVFVWV